MAAFPVVEAVRIAVERGQVVLYGDQALLELGARRAIHLDQLVGPYSREGFHHPGPAVFYLLAPFVRLLEPAGPGLYLGAIAISGAALIAAVAVVWRRAGPAAALWAAAAIDLYCLCLGVGTLRQPWNPYLVVTPMVLFVVLWATGLTRFSQRHCSGPAVWAVVVGSYEVQTHIATAGLVVPMSVILVGWLALRAWRDGRFPVATREGWGPARVTGALALALIWLAPVIELWRDHPNNLRLLWDFFTSPHAGPTLHQAIEATADAITIVPFGNHDYVVTLSRSDTALAIGTALIAIGLAVAIILGWRRRQPLALALAASSVIGIAAGVASLAHTAGPIYFYFAVWLAYVPLAVLLAIGVALVGDGRPEDGRPGPSPRRNRRPARPLIAGCAAAALVAGGLAVYSDLAMGPVTSITAGAGPWPAQQVGTSAGRALSQRDTIALTRAAESELRPGERWAGFTVGTPSLWTYVAGMVLQLDEHGVQSTVAPASWALYFGHERSPGRPVDVAFDLYAAGDTAAAKADKAAKGTVIAEVDGTVLTFQRLSRVSQRPGVSQ